TEKAILGHYIELLKQEGFTAPPENNQLISILEDKGRSLSKTPILGASAAGSFSAFLLSRAGLSMIPLYGTALSATSLAAAGVSLAAGPAFSVLLPCIAIIHAQRRYALDKILATKTRESPAFLK